MTTRRCVLCGREGRPMTREHVFARWLVERLRGARLVPTFAVRESSEQARISRVVAPVCAECNGGWMSGLEVSFRQAVFARPRVGVVQPPDRATISRWFTKTAVLLAHDRGAFVSDADRARLVTGMPQGVEVFIARRRRPPQRLDFALDVAANGDATAVRAVAVQVDDLVAHVAVDGVLAAAHGTRLWPLRTHAIRWETLPVIAPRILAAGARSA